MEIKHKQEIGVLKQNIQYFTDEKKQYKLNDIEILYKDYSNLNEREAVITRYKNVCENFPFLET